MIGGLEGAEDVVKSKGWGMRGRWRFAAAALVVGFVMQRYGRREESTGEKREGVRRLRENGGKRGRFL
jgi:hypothetical protein